VRASRRSFVSKSRQNNQRRAGLSASDRLQHVLPCWRRSRAGLRRDHPLLFEMRLENVFLSVRRRVVLLLDDVQFDDLLFEQAQRPVWRNRRRRPQASASAWLQPRVEKFGAARSLNCICGSASFEPFSTNCVASARCWRAWCPEPRHLAVTPARRLDTSLNSMRAFVSKLRRALSRADEVESCSRSSELSARCIS